MPSFRKSEKDHLDNDKSLVNREMDDNTLDYFGEDLTTLFQLDKAKIQSLIDGFNTYGANLGLEKFGELTGIDPSIPGDRVRYSLAFLTHNYMYHYDSFIADTTHTKIDKHTVDKITHFIESLDAKGKKGLNLIYESSAAISGWPRISAITDGSIQIKEILNEKEDTIGYLPFTRFNIEIENEQNENTRHSIFADLDMLYSLIKGLNNMYDEALKSAKRYKKQLGELVILGEETEEK